MHTDNDASLSDEATFAGAAKRRPTAEMSLGDERTLGGGGDAAGIDTVIDDIEVVDLEARYRVEGTLGQGGMGAVLLATDTRLDRKVAIKRILGGAAGNRIAVQRFLTKAKAIAALNHTNIVQIYDYGRAKNGPFLIMEYADGGSLLDRCRESALPLDEAIDIACQLCDGLAKAHDLGIIHRDIKPANVLLTKDGLPKLTDFGLAKAEATDHGVTIPGAVMGTPDFSERAPQPLLTLQIASRVEVIHPVFKEAWHGAADGSTQAFGMAEAAAAVHEVGPDSGPFLCP